MHSCSASGDALRPTTFPVNLAKTIFSSALGVHLATPMLQWRGLQMSRFTYLLTYSYFWTSSDIRQIIRTSWLDTAPSAALLLQARHDAERPTDTVREPQSTNNHTERERERERVYLRKVAKDYWCPLANADKARCCVREGVGLIDCFLWRRKAFVFYCCPFRLPYS